MVERILLPLDGSALAERALPYAISLAAASGARLILMHGSVPPVIDRAPKFDIQAFTRKLRAGQTSVPLAALAGITIEAITHDIFAEREAEGICASIIEQDADLVVMSTHGYGGLGRWIYGGVADQVLCESPVPVVMVPTGSERIWPTDAPLRILVGLDGSQFAEEVLEPVSTLASSLKAELLLVGASGPLEHSYAEGVMGMQAGFDAAIRETQTYLDTVAARLRMAGLSVTATAESGRPSSVIDGITRRRHIDLIAMATHGRSGIARMALGSVAAEVLQRSTVPLLLWRPAAVRHEAARATTASAAR